MTIEVTISKDRVKFLGNSILVEIEVIKDMKKAGIPVTGNAFFYGVDHGTLEITSDNEKYIYRWRPDPKRKAVSKPAYDPLNDDEDEEL